MGNEISAGALQFFDAVGLMDLQAALDRAGHGFAQWGISRDLRLQKWPTADQLEPKHPLPAGATFGKCASVTYRSGGSAQREEQWSITPYRTQIPHMRYQLNYVYEGRKELGEAEELLRFLVDVRAVDLVIYDRTHRLGEAFAVYLHGKITASKTLGACWTTRLLEGGRSIVADLASEARAVFALNERTAKTVQLATPSDRATFAAECDDLLVGKLGQDRFTQILSRTGLSVQEWLRL